MSAKDIPLINREREVAELQGALASALGGSGRLVLLAGEPGIGKTRLASVIAIEAAARGVPVWWGRGWEDGSAPAFWPWNTALRRWLDHAGPAAVAAAAGASAPELAHVFPVLRERLPDLSPGEGSGSESARARFRLFDLVNRFLAAVAKPAGLVVVLDDLHWADRSSLKLLEFVAADMAATRLLIVATYRDTEVEHAHPLGQTLSLLAREAPTRRVLLGGLTAAHCARWLTVAGATGDADALGEELHRETNGNPFFIGEMVAWMTGEDEAASPDARRVPHGVREVVARRLARLGDDCRATLAVAALLGDTIDAGLLADVVRDAATAGAAPVDHLPHVALALRDRVLVEVEPGRYGFAHAIVRRVLLDEMPAPARAAWHARIAAVLERQALVSDAITTEIVHHLAAAGTPDALQRAFDYACRGGEQAARGLGWEEAVRLYEIALDVGARSGLLDTARAIELRLALARALRGVGDVPAARACADEIMATCRRADDAAGLARAALLYAGPMPEWGRIEPPVRAALEEAWRAAPDLPDALRARLGARLAGDLIAANTVEEGARILALCDEAAAAARRSGAADALAIALLGRYTAAVMELGPSAAGAAPDAGDVMAAADASGEHEYAAATRYLRAMLLFADGEPEAFGRAVDELATAAATSRVPEALWFAEVLAALRATVQGRFAEGKERMERALAIGQRAQLANALGVYVSQRIMWHVLHGRLGEIAAELDVFVDAHSLGSGWKPLRALARFDGGDVTAARNEYRALLAHGLGPAERGVMARTYLMGLATLCVALRDREHAPMLYDCVARRADVWSIGGGQSLGPWALVLGVLARLCGRLSDAERHYEEAIALGRRMGSPPIVARAQSLLASLRLSREPDADEREGIAAMLAEAARSAEELGLAHVQARVARLHAKMEAMEEMAATPVTANVFRHDGDIWSVRYAGRDLLLKDGKGPRYLASLLAAPGRELHVLQFVTPAPATTRAAAPDGLTIGSAGRALDAAPDERARRAYRARIADLRAEIDEAEQYADQGRVERLHTELEELLEHLAGTLTARPSRSGPSETARKAVTKVIRTQIGKLLDLHPPLGRHLRETVRMGTVCVYAPTNTVEWEVGFGA